MSTKIATEVEYWQGRVAYWERVVAREPTLWGKYLRIVREFLREAEKQAKDATT